MADEKEKDPLNDSGPSPDSISFGQFFPEEAPHDEPEEEKSSRERIDEWKERGEEAERRIRGRSTKPEGRAPGPGGGVAGETEGAVEDIGEAVGRGVARQAGRGAIQAGGRAVGGTVARGAVTAAGEGVLGGATEGAAAGSVVPGAGTAVGAAVGLAVGVADAGTQAVAGILKGEYRKIEFDSPDFIFLLLVILALEFFLTLLYFVGIGIILNAPIRVFAAAAYGLWMLWGKGSTKQFTILRVLVKCIAFLFPLSLPVVFVVECILHNKPFSLLKAAVGGGNGEPAKSAGGTAKPGTPPSANGGRSNI